MTKVMRKHVEGCCWLLFVHFLMISNTLLNISLNELKNISYMIKEQLFSLIFNKEKKKKSNFDLDNIVSTKFDW